MADEQKQRNNDLILAPNEYALILDETKGQINTYVGPHKTSLANTDRPVSLDPTTRKFKKVELDQSQQCFPFAAEGDYIVLQNPAPSADNPNKPPNIGNSSASIALNDGQRINIPGPVTFPLWPGQIAKVISGHHLKLNQYLVVRVYNEEAAQLNWNTAVVKKTGGESGSESPTIDPVDLTTGQLLLIKGTDVSFYIPPTGLEVLPENEQYIREAVTLERLEYCILLDEDGNKRYVSGPDVVFPNPTERFIVQNSDRKFRAIQLPENAGIYIQVIADYEEMYEGDEEPTKFSSGDEIFITGATHPIYFPRQEHSIVKYGEEILHYAVAIPVGEGRYVLDKHTGVISTVTGPKMFLADPRKEVIVQRVLTQQMVSLLYPNNKEALSYNAELEGKRESTEDIYETDSLGDLSAGIGGSTRVLYSTMSRAAAHEAPSAFAGDLTKRKTKFTKPRSIKLDSKYEGAVSVSVYTGYAIMAVRKTGEQRVVVGPQTTLLEYDESVMVLELSTGKPKTTDETYKTAYLCVKNNKVSDIIEAVTKDMVAVSIKVSYRVNFESETPSGEDIPPAKWFDVENYVKFLCDHCRSRVRNKIQRLGIQEFNENATDTVRDIVLGEAKGGAPRTGLFFDENGMRIYDLEVLKVSIGDEKISQLLNGAQHGSVQRAIQTREDEAILQAAKASENIKRQTAQEKSTTDLAVLELNQKVDEVKHQMRMAQLKGEISFAQTSLEKTAEDQAIVNLKAEEELNRKRKEETSDLEVKKLFLELEILSKEAETQAVTDRMAAISGDLVAALSSFGTQDAISRIAEAMGPMTLLGGKSAVEIISSALKGTVLEDVSKVLQKGVATITS